MTKHYHNLINDSKKEFVHPYEIPNFISQDEIKICQNIYSEMPVFSPASHERATRKDYLMHSDTDKRMQDIFMPKLQAITPDKQISIVGGNFTTWHKPVIIHTDGYQLRYNDITSVLKKQQVLGLAVLVPLGTDTNKGTPSTVFFEQQHFGEERNYSNHSEILKSGKDIENFTHQKFDTNNLNSHLLDHNSQEQLFGFSVEKVIPWKFGSAIVWHRAQFHCSSTFDQFNSKLHLIFFIDFV
jgi:hypothetical protein